jgi:hypothetical protein
LLLGTAGVNLPIIEAKYLRDKEKLIRVPDNQPGWYRWWAKEEEVQTL